LKNYLLIKFKYFKVAKYKIKGKEIQKYSPSILYEDNTAKTTEIAKTLLNEYAFAAKLKVLLKELKIDSSNINIVKPFKPK